MSGHATESIEKFVAELLDAGIVLIADGTKLIVRSGPNHLTEERRRRLAVEHTQVRRLINQRYRSPANCFAARNGSRPCRQRSVCALPEKGRPCLISPTCALCNSLLPDGHKYICQSCLSPG